MEESLKISGLFKGTAQQERLLTALLPAYAKIDERDLQDHLAFVGQFARFLSFFNEKNQTIGNWQPIVFKDELVYLANLIDEERRFSSKLIDELIIEIIDILNEQAKQNGGEGETKESSIIAIDKYNELFALVAQEIKDVDNWYRNSLNFNQSKGSSLLFPLVDKMIKDDLSTIFKLLCGWLEVFEERDIEFGVKDSTFKAFSEVWFEASKKVDQLLFVPPEASPNELFSLLLEDLRKSHRQLLFNRTYVAERAPILLHQALEHSNDHPPDVGILLSFLHLFKYAQEHLNEITHKHLNHYYYDIIHQTKKAPHPDWTVVNFKLTEGVQKLLLKKGTPLLAGVNEEGLSSIYHTEYDILVTPFQIAELKTLHLSKNPLVGIGSSYRLISDVFAAPVANSADGLGAPFIDPQRGWPVFGEDQMLKAKNERQMIYGKLGLAIASPVLRLGKANRVVSLYLTITDESRKVFNELISDIDDNYDRTFGRIFKEAFQIYFSGPEGWFEAEEYLFQPTDSHKGDFVLRVPLPIDCPPVVDHSPAAEIDSLDTSLPIVKIVIDESTPVFPYSFLNELELDSIFVEARVFDSTDLALYNDAGQLDPSAPYYPFGSLPNRGSYLLMGNVELFSKPIKELSIELDWATLPDLPGGWKSYLETYPDEIDNESFKVEISALSGYHFKPLEDKGDREEFNLFSANGPATKLHSTTELKNIDVKKLSITPDYKLTELPEYGLNISAGFFRLDLTNPPMMFGNKVYPHLLSEALIHNIQPKKKETKPVPNEPFVPMMKKIKFSYRAESKIVLEESKFRENDLAANEKIFHYHPFGTEAILNQGKATKNHLFPHFDFDGYLYIGLEGIVTPQPIALYFDMQESVLRTTKASIEVEWSYLAKNTWFPMGQEELIADGTENLTTSGIVVIDIPQYASPENTILTPGLIWLRVAARGNLGIVGRLFNVYPNAVRVRWQPNGDPEHHNTSVDLPRLEKLLNPIPEIELVSQLTSFKGRYPLESEADFYVRISERLRHKNRGINSWDIEHILLERFPAIYQVKCIGPSAMDSDVHLPVTPGEVYVAVVTKPSEENPAPQIGYNFLTDIQAFLDKLTSSFATFKVVNPLYETLKVACTIQLKKGLHIYRGEFLKRLHDDIHQFICPWITQKDKIDIGGSIRKTALINFIKALPYVSFVTRFSIAQIYEDELGKYEILDTARPEHDRDIITGTTPWSVLIPVDQHQISFVETGKYVEPEITAIESMRMETDFVVVRDFDGDPDHAPEVEELFSDEFVPLENEDKVDWYLTVGQSEEPLEE